MIHKKLLSLLVLLITAATGAWAEEVTVTFTQADLDGIGTVAKDGVTLTPGNNRVHNDGNLYNYGSTTFSVDKGTFTKIEIVNCSWGNISGWQKIQTGSYRPYPEDEPDRWDALYTLTWTGEAESVAFTASVFNIQSIVFTIDKPDVDVTTNNAQGETTFTEASFAMPAFDATADYELVRDMSVQMGTKVGDAADGADYRIRIKKDNNAWALADMQITDLLALITVRDSIENEDLAFYGQNAVCSLNIFALDDNDQPTGNAITDFASLEPGRYVLVATAVDGSDYDGETAPSNVFELYQGYEVVIPAGEMITYYKDEALKLDDEETNAALYTITSVSGTTATATLLQTAPANTPILVKNLSDTEEKKILLIPTEGGMLSAIQRYAGFVGTLEPTTIAASTDNQTNYALNGKQFVYVKNAISVGANKAWLEVPASNARSLKVVFGEATSIHNSQCTMHNDAGDWYDLSGRRVATPSKKGVYIMNGKKVVVK